MGALSRRRRGLLLLGLALVLGGLAAADVARREAAIARQLAPLVPVVVAGRDLPAGRSVGPADLALRRVPARYAPAGAAAAPAEVLGQELAVPVAAGAPVGPGLLDLGGSASAGAPVEPGERAVDVTALGAPDLVVPGARVDVLVTREREGGAPGGAELALEDVEVLAARAAADDGRAGVPGPRVSATLRVSVRQAVYLAAAQAFARELRLLPRAAGDRGRTGGVVVGEGLR